MVAINRHSLLHFEDLTLPSFQVIVMTANMDCAQCREKVSKVISKMAGLREYTVDVRNRQVIVKADIGLRRLNVKEDSSKIEGAKKLDCQPLQLLCKCLTPICFGKQPAD